jgi:hypothetical protein
MLAGGMFADGLMSFELLQRCEFHRNAASTRNFLLLLQKLVAINFSARIALSENIESR